MAELEKVIKEWESVLSRDPLDAPWDLIDETLALLKEQEAVVRCKDCRHWLPMDRFHQDYHPGRGDCELNCWVRDFDWYCADGERRESGNDN